ncbi:MAG: hypothetical protein IIC02_03180 [Planctomycetes bacterium]|nr:hypothetical protein [Planctomycetota bacterium]
MRSASHKFDLAAMSGGTMSIDRVRFTFLFPDGIQGPPTVRIDRRAERHAYVDGEVKDRTSITHDHFGVTCSKRFDQLPVVVLQRPWQASSVFDSPFREQLLGFRLCSWKVQRRIVGRPRRVDGNVQRDEMTVALSGISTARGGPVGVGSGQELIGSGHEDRTQIKGKRLDDRSRCDAERFGGRAAWGDPRENRGHAADNEMNWR